MRKLYNETQLDFDDVLLVPDFALDGVDLSSRSKANITVNYKTPVSNRTICGVPIIAANMDGVGTIEVAKALAKHRAFTALHKHYPVEKLVNFFGSDDDCHDEGDSFFGCGSTCAADYSFYSMGINDHDLDKFNAVKRQVPIKNICVDVANGYMHKFYDVLSRLREENPDAIIMAGNVVTQAAAVRAYKAGVDIVKMGIGSGATCRTRTQTGVGFPQFSCVLNCKEQLELWSRETAPLICSDGGCVEPGDVAKAIAAGANFVMLGSMLAGTDEGGGELVDGKVQFYGMSSKTANEKHSGGLQNYRSSEGRTVMVPYKGSMDEVITNILGGLRSVCTYLGTQNIMDLYEDAAYIEVNSTHNLSLLKYTVGD